MYAQQHMRVIIQNWIILIRTRESLFSKEIIIDVSFDGNVMIESHEENCSDNTWDWWPWFMFISNSCRDSDQLPAALAPVPPMAAAPGLSRELLFPLTRPEWLLYWCPLPMIWLKNKKMKEWVEILWRVWRTCGRDTSWDATYHVVRSSSLTDFIY